MSSAAAIVAAESCHGCCPAPPSRSPKASQNCSGGRDTRAKKRVGHQEQGVAGFHITAVTALAPDEKSVRKLPFDLRLPDEECVDNSRSLEHYQQLSIAFISAAILIVAKFEKVSETAYGKMIWSWCRMAPHV
jgi:hypothetical protein